MTDPKAVFKEAVYEWIAANDQIQQAQKELKEVRRKKGELGVAILEYMRKNNYDECGIGEDGKLVRRESKRVEGLKADHVLGELKRKLGETEAEDMLKTINEKREVIVKESLSRRKGKGTTTATDA